MAVTAAFVVAAVVLIFIVRTNIRGEPRREAEEIARVMLDRNLATHTYFTTRLKPAVFPLSDRVMPPDYFEPTWMSSTYAVREIDRLFHKVQRASRHWGGALSSVETGRCLFLV